MELNYLTWFTALIVLFQTVDSSFFDCHSKKGLYYGLNKRVQECLSLNYVPTLRDLRKKGGTVDGSRLVSLLNTYCRRVDKVNSCVMDYISISPCRERQEKMFKDLVEKSNYICEEGPKQLTMAKLASLPLMTISSRDRCYREAAKASYICRRRFYRPRMDILKTRTQTLAAFPCTYNILRGTCTPDAKAEFYTVLYYDEFILPPALGVNATEILLQI